MVNVEDAVQIASDYLAKVMPGYVALGPKIEEFELSKDGSIWSVTFRAKNPDPDQGRPNVFYPYVDKKVQIRTDNGALLAIRNWVYE